MLHEPHWWYWLCCWFCQQIHHSLQLTVKCFIFDGVGVLTNQYVHKSLEQTWYHMYSTRPHGKKQAIMVDTQQSYKKMFFVCFFVLNVEYFNHKYSDHGHLGQSTMFFTYCPHDHQQTLTNQRTHLQSSICITTENSHIGESAVAWERWWRVSSGNNHRKLMRTKISPEFSFAWLFQASPDITRDQRLMAPGSSSRPCSLPSLKENGPQLCMLLYLKVVEGLALASALPPEQLLSLQTIWPVAAGMQTSQLYH